jgi:hypothetical protein
MCARAHDFECGQVVVERVEQVDLVHVDLPVGEHVHRGHEAATVGEHHDAPQIQECARPAEHVGQLRRREHVGEHGAEGARLAEPPRVAGGHVEGELRQHE